MKTSGCYAACSFFIVKLLSQRNHGFGDFGNLLYIEKFEYELRLVFTHVKIMDFRFYMHPTLIYDVF
ncbi:unknown [Acidiphilium sp. CAG:727]|nr:unknown [Acidiphilium sp. CAG:727]